MELDFGGFHVDIGDGINDGIFVSVLVLVSILISVLPTIGLWAVPECKNEFPKESTPAELV